MKIPFSVSELAASRQNPTRIAIAVPPLQVQESSVDKQKQEREALFDEKVCVGHDHDAGGHVPRSGPDSVTVDRRSGRTS